MSFNLRALLLLSALSLASCRGWVLEDRTGCPRLLYFDIEDAGSFEAETQVQVHAYAHPTGQALREAATTVLDIQRHSFGVEVRSAQQVRGYAFIGGETLVQGAEGWTLPVGISYAPLFRFSYLVSVPEEYGVLPVVLLKEYVGVCLEFTGNSPSFDVTVRANTCGISPETGQALPGPFECRPSADADACFRFNLPRLCDDHLTLELKGRNSLPETLDLNQILLEAGLDWTEPSLPDVGLVIDVVEHSIKVTMMPWEWQNLHYEY